MSIESNRSTHISLQGQEFLYFGGTNYLGLAHRQELWDAAALAFERYGLSSGASRLTSGETEIMLELEGILARFARCEASLVLPAGFMSNIAVVEALSEQIDHWIVSKSAHGSIKSALDNAANVETLESITPASISRLRATCAGRLGVFIEPVEALTGMIFDLKELLESAGEKTTFILDEAHSMGVLGNSGGGALEHFGVNSSAHIIRTGTFSKAFGGQGGFVLGTQGLIESIKKLSPAFRASTALSPVLCAAAMAALKLIQTNRTETIDALKQNIAHTNKCLMELGFEQFSTHALPIFSLPGSAVTAKILQILPTRNIYVPAVSAYFKNQSAVNLRWTIQAAHTTEHLDQLLGEIKNAYRPKP